MTRNTTPSNSSTIRAADVIRALQDAAATAYATKDAMQSSQWTPEHKARALVYLCSETADWAPQEHWEDQEFNDVGLVEQSQHGIQPGDYCIRSRLFGAKMAIQTATDAAAAELRAHAPASFIRIRTGARSSMKILNTRERIAEMVAIVRRSPALFGGGPVEKITKPTKPAQWKARSVSMVWELIQDGDHAAALAMADTMGAMFYCHTHAVGMTWAPMPVDGMPEGFVSARRSDGAYSVFHTSSMLGLNGNTTTRSRAKAEEIARSIWASKDETQQAYALQHSADNAQDQTEARAQWIAHHRIETIAEATQHDDATEAPELTTEDLQPVAIVSELTGATLGTVPRHVADQVSELIASATTAAVIEQASEADPLATPDECEEADPAPELATVDACSEASATATSCDASSAGNAPSAPHVVYSQLKPGDAFRLYPQGAVYIKTRGGHRPGRGGPLDRAYEGRTVYRWYGDERDQAPAVSTPAPAVHTAPAPAAPTFQTIIGKSGNWCARFRRLPDGDHVLEFSTRPNDWSIYVYKTGRERMAALQAMAREADELASADDGDDNAPYIWPLDPMTATAADVQALSAAEFGVFFDHLEDINHHGECLLLRAQRAGRDDLAERARVNIRAHLAAGHLAPELATERQAIARDLTASEADQAPATHAPNATPAPAGEYQQPAPVPKTQTEAGTDPADNMPRAVPDEIASLDSIREAIRMNETEMERIIKGKQKYAAERAYKIELIIADLTNKAVELQKKMKQAPAGEYQQPAPVPKTETEPDTEPADNMPRAVADESAPEFTRTAPQPFDMLAMIAAGLAPDGFVGLGIVYSGDRANPSGRGAITDVQPCSWYKYTVTVTLEDGRQSRLNPVSFTDHLGNRFRTDFKRHGAPYLAELEAARLAAEASRKAANQAAADEKDRQRRELPQQWPQLKAYDPAGKLSGCTLAAANIRILLKEKFPGIKFSVKTSKFSGGDDINVSWTDGPAQKDVEAIADLFSAGSFDGMEDIYNYRRSVFTDLFGDSKYIFCNRDISPELLAQAIADEWPNPQGRPSVEDYQKARGAFDFIDQKGNRRRIEERLNRMGWNFKS